MNTKKLPYSWRELIHYVIVTGSVFMAHEFTDVTGIEMKAVESGGAYWVILFAVYLVFIFLADKFSRKTFIVK